VHVSLCKILAFIRRDYRVDVSYKVAFAFELLRSGMPVVSVFFIAKLVDGVQARSLGVHGGRYFAFALLGVAVSQYLLTVLGTFGDVIRRSQMEGCLEAMLSTRTRATAVAACSCIYTYLSKFIGVVLILLAGGALGISYQNSNWLAASVIFLLTIFAFSGLGILSAAFILVFKKGEPIMWLMGALSSLLGGVLFPVRLLPPWLKWVSYALPIRYSLDAIRGAILEGNSLLDLQEQALALMGMACVFMVLGLWCFSRAVERGRQNGSLAQY